jgi:hypothetical protein
VQNSYLIEHLAEKPNHKSGTIIKKGQVIAIAGLTGLVEANSPLVHVCRAKESNRKIKDFSRGGNKSYVNATILDPTQMVKDFGLIVVFEYLAHDQKFYKYPKAHLGVDGQGRIKLTLPYDIKVIECGHGVQFGNCMSYEKVPPILQPTKYKMGQYYKNGWKKDNKIPFYNTDPLLKPETNVKRYGENAFILTQDAKGWSKNTRFKK